MIEARLQASGIIDDACSGADSNCDEAIDLYFTVFNEVRGRVTQHRLLDRTWRQTLYTEGDEDA